MTENHQNLEETLGIQDETEIESRVFIEKILYRLAKEHTDKALQAAEEYGRSRSNVEFGHALQAITLSAILLESFVNYYGQKALGEREWQDYDKKTKPCLSQKWQKLLDLGSVPRVDFSVKNIEKVSKARNYIVHHRQFFHAGRKVGRDYVTTARAKICANEAKQIFNIAKTSIQKYFNSQGNEMPKWID